LKILLVFSFNVGNFVSFLSSSVRNLQKKTQSGLWTNVVVVQHGVLLAAGRGRSDIRECIRRLFDQCLTICSTHAFHVAKYSLY